MQYHYCAQTSSGEKGVFVLYILCGVWKCGPQHRYKQEGARIMLCSHSIGMRLEIDSIVKYCVGNRAEGLWSILSSPLQLFLFYFHPLEETHLSTPSYSQAPRNQIQGREVGKKWDERMKVDVVYTSIINYSSKLCPFIFYVDFIVGNVYIIKQ